MKKINIGVLTAAIVFAVPSQSAFDQLEVATFSFYGDANDFVSDELSLLQLITSDLDVGSGLPLVPAPRFDEDESAVSLNASAVPLPSAVWFFGSALIALTVIQRRS